MFEDIHIIDDKTIAPELLRRMNLDRDVIFSFPSYAKSELNFNYSGIIKFISGEEINLSTLRNKINPNSPIRYYKSKINMKFCCPNGIAPVFLKPSESKSILTISSTFNNYIDVRVNPNSLVGDRPFESKTAVIYENLVVDITFNKDVLYGEYPSMILPNSFKLFDMLLCQTIFSNTLSIGQVFVIKNTEFYNTFKEAI